MPAAEEWTGCSLGALLAHCQLGHFGTILQGRGVTVAAQLVVPDEAALRQLLSEVGMARADAIRMVQAAQAVRAEALQTVRTPTQMQLHKPDGSFKHRRWFWVDQPQQTLSWAKKASADGKTARVFSTKHVTVSKGKSVYERLGLKITTGACGPQLLYRCRRHTCVIAGDRITCSHLIFAAENGPLLVVAPDAATHARWMLGLLLLTPEVVPNPTPQITPSEAPQSSAAPAMPAQVVAQPGTAEAMTVAAREASPGPEETEVWRGEGLAPLSWLLAAGVLTTAQYQQRLEVQMAAAAQKSLSSSSARPPPLPQGRRQRRSGACHQSVSEGVPPGSSGYLASCDEGGPGSTAIMRSREEDMRQSGRLHGRWSLQATPTLGEERAGALAHSAGLQSVMHSQRGQRGGSAVESTVLQWSIARDLNGGGVCGANPTAPYLRPSLLGAATRRLAFAMLASPRLASDASQACDWARWNLGDRVGGLVVGADLAPWPLGRLGVASGAEQRCCRCRSRAKLQTAQAAAADQPWGAIAASFWCVWGCTRVYAQARAIACVWMVSFCIAWNCWG